MSVTVRLSVHVFFDRSDRAAGASCTSTTIAYNALVLVLSIAKVPQVTKPCAAS